MAHQTSRALQKQATPRSIGRLMDADFSGLIFSFRSDKPLVASTFKTLENG